MKLLHKIDVVTAVTLLILNSYSCTNAQEQPARSKQQSDQRIPANPALEQAIQKLKMPGVTINLAERCVDLDGKICLEKGMLELVACTKGTKEHESIVVIEARPMHIHTALLLLGAEPGNPAIRRISDGDDNRLLFTPPKGDPIDVLLVFPDKSGKPAEHSIDEFITRTQEEMSQPSDAVEKKESGKFPTHSFLFAGSHLVENGPGPRKYLSDESGNVISIVTFGDELLCLSGVHSEQKDQLLWQVKAGGLPAVGTKVLLRLRPRPKHIPLHKSLNKNHSQP